MVDVRDQQRKENVQLLDLLCQNGVFTDNTVDQLISAQILLPDLADVDALPGCRTDGNKCATDVVAGSKKFMALERRDDEDLSAFSPHAEGD